MKILVTGSQGQVGSSLVKQGAELGFDMFGFSSAELDITRESSIADAFQKVQPELVINAAAYTAVDRAESDKETAYAVNEIGPKLLAAACQNAGVPLFHISTDYVFDGEKEGAYSELDATSPTSVYGRSKLMGELAVAALPRHIILRTAWVFSAVGSNFVKTMLRVGGAREELSVVGDQKGGPTSAIGIARTLLSIAKQYEGGKLVDWGTYHYSGYPYVSWYDFAKEIFAKAEAVGVLDKGPRVNQITSNEYPTPVKRPSNSCLSLSKIQTNFQIAPDDWSLALDDVLNELAADQSQS